MRKNTEKGRRRVRTAIPAALCLALCLSGCSSRELDEMQMVAGGAVDVTEAGVALTAELADAESGSDVKLAPALLSASGGTLSQAMEQMERRAEKALYWSHVQMLVVGEETAKTALSPLLAQMQRDEALRLNLCLCVAKGLRGEEIFAAESTETEKIRSFGLREGFRHNRETGAAPDGALFRLIRSINRGESALVPAVTLTQEEKPRAVFCGAAVLSEGKLTGFLNERETTLAMIVAGEGKDGVLSLMDGALTLRVRSGSVRQISGAGQEKRLCISITGVVKEQTQAVDLSDRGALEALEQAAGEELSADFGALMARGEEELSADILGLSTRFAEEGEETPAEGFPPPEVTVHIAGSGMTFW